MKARNSLRFLPFLVITISFSTVGFPGRADAATNRFWNAGGTGGDGNWGTSPGDKNWNITAGAPAGNTFWPDSIDDLAVFQDATGGTVTVFDQVQTAGIVQNGANYTINAGIITLVRDSALAQPFIDVQTGTLAIDSALDGTNGLIKNGTGGLVLSNANTYTGTTSLASGTLTLAGSLASSSVEISSNAGLLDQSGGLAAATALINSGTLTLNAADSVSTYTQNGTGTLAGSAALTALGGATLNGGTISSSLLGDTTSTGTVLVSGSIGGGSLSITGGILTLTGSSTHVPVGISNGATLVDSSGGLAPSAAVTNAGTLRLNAADSVSTYTQNGTGTLAGSAALTALGGATLNGGTISGSLLGDTTSAGTVLVSGSMGGGSLSITGGILTLTGSSTHAPVGISNGATLVDSSGGLTPSAIVTNSGTLTLNTADSVSTYTQNGTGTLAGSAALTALGGATLNGGTISGSLLGITTSTGAVLVSGAVGGGSLSVTGGTLTLTGISTHTLVNVSAPAAFVDSNGGLDASAAVINAGTLTVIAADTIKTYISNGGMLAGGTGRLTTTTAYLNGHSSVGGRLSANTLTSSGTVSISGSAAAENIRIASGILTNSGTLGTLSTHLDIASGATLIAGGIQRYAWLTTSGAGTAMWQGNLKHSSTLAPGGAGGTGTLRVNGDFINSPGGTLKFDIHSSGHDLLKVTGTATFGGSLNLNQLGNAPITPFVAIPVVSAAGYNGNFNSLTENLDGAVWFNPGNGTVMRITPTGETGMAWLGATENQKSTWASLYDDVIDPGATNIKHNPGATPEYEVSSGIADDGNPDLAWALAASFTPTGLDADLLNHLSPEVYTGFSDYAAQATRTHQRTALSAPPLAPRRTDDSKSGLGSSSKEPAKDGILTAPTIRDWEFFAAADYFNLETDSSHNSADYELSSMGIIAGGRTQLLDRTRLAAYLAADNGSIDGSLIDSDAIGWSVGLISETLLDEKSQTRFTAALSYGRYNFDGSRDSVSATRSGWAPGRVDFSNVDSRALEVFLGLEGIAYQKNGFRVSPSAGVRYAGVSVDGFSESTGTAAGSPIALDIDGDHHDALLAEMGILAEADLTAQLTVWGQAGFNAGIGEDSHVLTATFAKGNRPMRAEADGLTNDLLFIGLGADYQINGSVSVGVGYRSEFRPSHHTEQGCSISSSFRF